MSIFESLHDNVVADTDLLRKNDELGDVFTIARQVDFAFETPDRERAADFAEFVTGKNFGRTEITETENNQLRILVFINMPITQHLVCSVSGFMLCLGTLFKISYKGWGSVIQK